MNTPLISIIIPVYNTERFLPYCLDSLLKQTYRNIEILLINDGSCDNSWVVCQEYAVKDSRIKLYSQENKGASAARNLGLQHAEGKYINFIDSDDYVDETFIETLYNDLSSGDYDFAMVAYKIEYEHVKIRISQTSELQVLTQKDLVNGLYNKMPHNITKWNDMLFMALWNKLYRKDLLKGLSFSSAVLSEDLEFNNRVFLRTKKAIFNGVNLYHYYQRKDSAAHQLLDKVQIWKVLSTFNCLKVLPENNKDYRAVCLIKLYKTIFLVRFLVRKLADAQDKRFVESQIKFISKQTLKELILNRCIPLRLKLVLLTFYKIPFLYTQFRIYNERKKKFFFWGRVS